MSMVRGMHEQTWTLLKNCIQWLFIVAVCPLVWVHRHTVCFLTVVRKHTVCLCVILPGTLMHTKIAGVHKWSNQQSLHDQPLELLCITSKLAHICYFMWPLLLHKETVVMETYFCCNSFLYMSHTYARFLSSPYGNAHCFSISIWHTPLNPNSPLPQCCLHKCVISHAFLGDTAVYWAGAVVRHYHTWVLYVPQRPHRDSLIVSL